MGGETRPLGSLEERGKTLPLERPANRAVYSGIISELVRQKLGASLPS